jgi:hypothetical protein
MASISVYEIPKVSGFASPDVVKVYLAYNRDCQILKTFFVDDQYRVVSELVREMNYDQFVIRNSAKPVLDERANRIQQLANWLADW